MQVTVNGKPTELADHCTASELVRRLGLEGKRFAMEVNGEILPRSTHETHRLAAGDRVEVVHAVGGG
jgi:sulfur carrier protein